jgi:hypothetical protein
MIFVRLPIVFFIVGNHGDISRFLQDLINQIETIMQQQVDFTIVSSVLLLIGYILVQDWLANLFGFICPFH